LTVPHWAPSFHDCKPEERLIRDARYSRMFTFGCGGLLA
jgi:hypothetical protein